MLSNYTWTSGSDNHGQIEISDAGQISDCLICKKNLTEVMFFQFSCLGVPSVDSTIADDIDKEKTLRGIVPVRPLPHSRGDAL